MLGFEDLEQVLFPATNMDAMQLLPNTYKNIVPEEEKKETAEGML